MKAKTPQRKETDLLRSVKANNSTEEGDRPALEVEETPTLEVKEERPALEDSTEERPTLEEMKEERHLPSEKWWDSRSDPR